MGSHQLKSKSTNYRTWKSGKSWLYSASMLTVLAGGTVATVTVLPTSVVAQADIASAASIAASTANSVASAANSAASVVVSAQSNSSITSSAQSSVSANLSSQASSFISTASSAIPVIKNASVAGSVVTSGTVSSYTSAVSSYSLAISQNSAIRTNSTAASSDYAVYSSAVSNMNSTEAVLSSTVATVKDIVKNPNSLTAADIAQLNQLKSSYAQYVSTLQSSIAALTAPEASYFSDVSSLQALNSAVNITGSYLVVDSATNSSLANASVNAASYLAALDKVGVGSMIDLTEDYVNASALQSSAASLAVSYDAIVSSVVSSTNAELAGEISLASSYYQAGNKASAATLMNSYYAMAIAIKPVFSSIASQFTTYQSTLSIAIESYNSAGSVFNSAAAAALSGGYISSYTPMQTVASTAAEQYANSDPTSPDYQIWGVDDHLARWTGQHMDGTAPSGELYSAILQAGIDANFTDWIHGTTAASSSASSSQSPQKVRAFAALVTTVANAPTMSGTPGQWTEASFTRTDPAFSQKQITFTAQPITVGTWGGSIPIGINVPEGGYVKVNPISVPIPVPPTAPVIEVTAHKTPTPPTTPPTTPPAPPTIPPTTPPVEVPKQPEQPGQPTLPDTGENAGSDILLIGGLISLGSAIVLAYAGNEQRRKSVVKRVLKAEHHHD